MTSQKQIMRGNMEFYFVEGLQHAENSRWGFLYNQIESIQDSGQLASSNCVFSDIAWDWDLIFHNLFTHFS